MPAGSASGYAINYGVKTGFNKAFIIDNETKEELVAKDPRSAEIIKPVLRGRDIQRFRAKWAGMWLIDTHNGYDNVAPIEIDDFPGVKEFLGMYGDKLARRYDKGRTPFNLRNCAYHALFSKPKLFWMDMSPDARFSFSDAEIYCNNKGFLLTGVSLRFLCAVLNSSIMTWFVKRTARTTGMGLVQWEKFAVERIPVPRVSKAEQEPFTRLVDHILIEKSLDADANTEEAEREVDRLTYELYRLTPHEVLAVEQSIS